MVHGPLDKQQGHTSSLAWQDHDRRELPIQQQMDTDTASYLNCTLAALHWLINELHFTGVTPSLTQITVKNVPP